MSTLTSKRIESIDILRGIAMVIMALDHVRDYFHIDAAINDPLSFDTTTPGLFMTRWVTHFCAPVFVFLSGTSIYLQSQRKSKKALSVFLIKRGLWLIIAEWTIIAFAWTFNPALNIIPFQVIWAIGISMVIIGVLLLANFRYYAFLALGIVLVGGINLLDIHTQSPGFQPNFWWDFFHTGVFKFYTYAPNHSIMLVYPFPAWVGLMMLGFCAGIYFSPKYDSTQRQKILFKLGLGTVAFFILLRLTNFYGDPVPWSSQENALYTFFSFIKTNKYPPSLLFSCMTIGPSLLLLAAMENVKNKFTDAMIIFGRTALFYYIIHIYVIHLLVMILFFINGHSWAEASEVGKIFPFYFVVPGEGYGLGITYLIWFVVVVGLYPICKWYDAYKHANRDIWWLSYL